MSPKHKKNAPVFVEDPMDDEFDLQHLIDNELNSELMAETIEWMMRVTDLQTQVALELTKIATSQQSASISNEERIFEIYRKALYTVQETSPLRDMFQEHFVK